MLFEIKNCIIKEVAGIQYGTTKNGTPFSKATVVLEAQDGNYTNTYAMEAFGDERVQKAKDFTGSRADIKFEIRAREYNGKWYSDIRLLFITPVDAAPHTQAAPAPVKEDDPDGDLPF